MVAKQRQTATEKTYVVKDVGGQIKCIFGMVFLGLISLAFMFNSFGGSEADFLVAVLCALFFGGIGVLVFYRFKAILPGIILNLETDEMEYPGGGNSLNHLGDYFKLDWWIQYWKRYTIDLKGVSEIEKVTIKHTTRSNGKTDISYRHFIKFVGQHGASQVQFSEEGKRDELYNTIRMHNRMGMPVFKS